MTQKALRKLEQIDEQRATLARQMATYLNHLQGCMDRDLAPADSDILRSEERILEARLAGL